MPSRRVFYFAIAVLAAAIAIAGAVLVLAPRNPVTGVGQALVGGPFTLTDHTGRKVSDQDFRGKYMLIFFGYTYCPDVCPTELQVMSAALDEMGSKAEEIVPIFITVDPERDTPEVMKAYVSNFHPRMVGLTGTPAEIAAVARAYRSYYKKAPGGEPDAYLMDHSSIIYLMDKDGTFRTHFTYITDARELAKALESQISG